ncbi:GtrA family protein [Nocardioides cynanchi]|uniref:GtrA family protein n=1 Tax=Nocardioides cynanchi TaxID=2558918 RepID=UPI00177C7211|nr:GtrA family protein [Nocardioides cynanchi]
MPRPPAPTAAPAPPVAETLGLGPKLLRYLGGSVVATVCSEVTFVLLYGPVHVGTTSASLVGWLAGAVPNYWLNRRWAWQRTGRPSFRTELLPYITIVLMTLLLATGITHLLDVWLHHLGTQASLRVALVAVAYLGVYALMFVLRFVLLDRLFERVARLEARHHHARTEAAS